MVAFFSGLLHMYFLTSVILGVRILICLCVFEGCLQVLICSREKVKTGLHSYIYGLTF